jgi:hypothetical protein
MVAELNPKSETGHKIDYEYCVLFYWVTSKDLVEKPHETHELEEN